MATLRNITALLTILLSAFLYHRSGILKTFYYNAPARLQKINSFGGKYEVKFQLLIRNCEDIHLNTEHGWALLSCDPGRDAWNTVMGIFRHAEKVLGTGVFFWRYGDEGATPELVVGGEDFHPLGIEFHEPSRTLFVVNHAFSGPKIEFYDFDPATVSATLKTSLYEKDGIWTPNSILAINEKEFFFTQDHHFRIRYNPILAKLETYLGVPGGSVAHWKKGEGVKTLARLPFANGIAMLNASTLAVASSSGAAVHLFQVQRDEGKEVKLRRMKSISLPFLPDNLSVDSRGNLLVAGHPHAPSLEAVAKKNGEGAVEGLKKLSWIAEWSEEEGLKDLFVGDEFGTSTTAVRDVQRGVGIAVGLYERGVLVWRE